MPNRADKILYCNGGNGDSIPSVQMFCELPNATDWTVRFSLNGQQVEYHLDGGNFQSQSENVFRNAVSSGVDELAGIPAAVKVIPK